MKKIFALFLTCVFTFCIFAGCEREESQTSSDFIEGLVSDPIESYDNVSFFVPEDDDSTEVSEESSKPVVSDTTSEESSEFDVSDTTSTESSKPDENSYTSDESQGEKPNAGGFLVMDKKYTYKGKNVVILNVENQTEKNYTVTINGKYLDKNGNVLKTETQTSNQYSANYQGYFLFDPDISFDEFTYTFETKQSSGPFYAKDIVYVFKGLSEWKVVNHELLAQGDRTKYPHICAEINMAYKGTTQLFVRSTWIFVNEKGQIVGLGNVNESILSDPKPTFEGASHLPLYYTKEDTLVWPDEFKGEITAILIIRDIELAE